METLISITQYFADNIEINFILKIILTYFAALWIALILWVTRDAINRSNNLLFQIFVIILNIILPIFGLIIYLIIRPTKTLLERYYDDLEYRALAENGDDKESCAKCKLDVSSEFEFCPNCGDNLRQECQFCNKKFAKRWKICPYCGKKALNKKEKEKHFMKINKKD